MRAAGTYVRIVENWGKWRFRTKLADPKQFGRRQKEKRHFKYIFCVSKISELLCMLFIMIWCLYIILITILDHFSVNNTIGMPHLDNTKYSQDESKITSMFEDTLLEKSNIILLGPTGCGMRSLYNNFYVLYFNRYLRFKLIWNI